MLNVCGFNSCSPFSSMDLWTEKYRPRKSTDVVGQNKAIGELLNWLQNWKAGSGLLLAGPPGTGKTALVEAAAAERGWLLLQINASDERNAEEIGVFAQTTKTRDLFGRKKLILLDEVDGIPGKDRGAGAAIIELIANSAFPVILTANDLWHQKLRSIKEHCSIAKFGKVHAASLEKRLAEIAKTEGVACEDGLLKGLARWSGGDLRSAITDLQTVCTGRQQLAAADVDAIGFREREAGMFDVLPAVFAGRSLNAARKAVQGADKDPDEALLWIETNTPLSFSSPAELASAYSRLAQADLFRNRVFRQQNWRFKAYMSDLAAAVGVGRATETGFVMYQPPQRMMMLGRTKGTREKVNAVAEKLGAELHCSRNRIKRDFFPFLKILIKEKKIELPLEKEELDTIRKF